MVWVLLVIAVTFVCIFIFRSKEPQLVKQDKQSLDKIDFYELQSNLKKAKKELGNHRASLMAEANYDFENTLSKIEKYIDTASNEVDEIERQIKRMG